MKYCTHCGAEMPDDATICTSCGCPLSGEKPSFNDNGAVNSSKYNTVSIVGFVFSFLIPIVGLICSIIGLKQVSARGERGRGLAIAGIIISIANWIGGILIQYFLLPQLLEQLGFAALL